MEKVIAALQTILNGLNAGIAAIGDFTDGVKSFASAGADAATGAASVSGAFKDVFNFFAGLFGIDALK